MMMLATNEVNEQHDSAGPRAPRPEIEVNDRSLDRMVADAWVAVHAANSPPMVLSYQGRMVRIVGGRFGPEVIPMNRVAFYGHLSRVADWVRATPRGTVAVFPRKDVARAMLAAPDPKLPILDVVASAPVFGSSGKILSEPGYHGQDRLWHHLPAGMDVPRIPTQPSPDEVAKARQLLEHDLLGDFPFAVAADRAIALAALLLPFARRLVDGQVPYHLVQATMTGSGRSLFVDVVGILATGSLVFGGQVAAQVPEVREYDPRRRGFKRLVPGSVRIRLDARVDRPWLRTGFRHPDLREWAFEHRNQLIHAALLLVQNWLALGRPAGGVRLPGFERWSEAMGGILTASGVEGLLDSERPDDASDASRNVLADLFAGWEELPNGLGSRGYTVAQALALLREDAETRRYSRLCSALGGLCLHAPGQLPTARKVGNALRRFRGCVMGGRKLQTRVVNGNNLWFVQLPG